ncbi:MAG: hypothetical protein ACRDBO_09785 [Lachnospiraceae bacterium]
MKSLREQFEDDYMAVSIPANNRDGFKIQYVYSAPWYLWNLPAAVLKQKKLLLAGLSVSSLLLFVLTGIQDSDLNRYRIVELGGTLALCAHVLELFSLVQFLFARERINRMTYFAINRVLSCIPFIRGLCLLLTVLGSVYYMLHNAFDMQNILMTGGYLSCAVMVFYISKEYRKIPLRTEKNEIK